MLDAVKIISWLAPTVAAAGIVAGCTFIAPNATDLPEAHFDLSDPFSYTRLNGPLVDAESLVEAARWDLAVPVSLVMTEFSFAPGEITFRRGVPYALKIGNQGVWRHAFVAKHFFRAVAVRGIEPAPFNGPVAVAGGGFSLIPDAYGPSAWYVSVAAGAALRGMTAPIRGADGDEMDTSMETTDDAPAMAEVPLAPFSTIELDPDQAVIVYFVADREGTYYLRSGRTDDVVRGMRGRIIIE